MTGVRLQFKIYGSAHAILDSAELYNAAFNYSALIRLQHLPERSVGKRGADVAQRADVANCAGFERGADVSPCADFARPAQVPPAGAALSGALREGWGVLEMALRRSLRSTAAGAVLKVGRNCAILGKSGCDGR